MINSIATVFLFFFFCFRRLRVVNDALLLSLPFFCFRRLGVVNDAQLLLLSSSFFFLFQNQGPSTYNPRCQHSEMLLGFI